MARVVCIHGIAQEYEAAEVLASKWTPALCGGVSIAGGRLEPSDVEMCFYGYLFRPQEMASKSAAKGDVWIEDDFERVLLESLADAAAPEVANDTKVGGRSIQAMLHRVAETPFFGRCAQEVVVRFLKQVWWYVTNRNQVRPLAQACLLKAVAIDTRVVVAHSLGSVIAYEVLCANRSLPVRTLVTLGSPLGIPALHPRLKPAIDARPGEWPRDLAQWFNIADRSDIVALEKKLASVFGPKVQDRFVNNGVRMHDVSPYLTARETGEAILAGLAAEAAGAYPV